MSAYVTGTEEPRRYSDVAITFHWLIAVLIIVNVGLALSVDSLPDDWVRPIVDTHKSIGITVFGLGLLRLLWRFGHTPPALPASYPRWEKAAAHLAHAALYFLIFALPLSGWLHDSAWKDAATHPLQIFDLVNFPRWPYFSELDPQAKEATHKLFGKIHSMMAFALYILLALHIIGALKHQFLDKAQELQRMLPSSKKMK